MPEKDASNDNNIKPFLKWAGGKRWFVFYYPDLIPKQFNRYIEPFLGSGAVFFHLRPRKAILGDINGHLIDTYQALKDNWRSVYRHLRKHEKLHNSKYYYHIREHKPRGNYARAARFIYLNRTCWNGLYRVNQEGNFNVPIGSNNSVLFPDDHFDKISDTLQNAKLIKGDFEDLIDSAKKGDLVFVDPPYTVRHNHNAFIEYNEKLFSWFDQERLFYAIKRAKKRGALIIGTNAYHESVRKLYSGHFNTKCVSRFSHISSKVETRRAFEELVILSE